MSKTGNIMTNKKLLQSEFHLMICIFECQDEKLLTYVDESGHVPFFRGVQVIGFVLMLV